MALLQWVPELDTGIAEIDTQHKRIVDYINKLHELRQTHHREGLAEVIPTARAAQLTMNREGIRRLAAEELGLPTSPYRFADSDRKSVV